MRLPSDLLRWAKTYARNKNSNVTRLFVDHLTKLREKETRNGRTASSR